jgi:hopanoid biosynthesis associated radical SAM protein HpnJ
MPWLYMSHAKEEAVKTLFLNPPSFEGFDGGAGSRYQARREIRSFWYPTWLAQPAAMVPDSKLIDAPADDLTVEDVVQRAKGFDLTIIHTSTPSLRHDVKMAERLKSAYPHMPIGFVGAHTMVLPEQTLHASAAIDFVTTGEFDYPLKEIAEGRPFDEVSGIAYRKHGTIVRTRDVAPIQNLDALPFVIDVYKRDLTIEHYSIGYLLHPYMSLYTGRGCHSRCTFCLWPQTLGGHVYRVRSPDHVYEEMALAKRYFPQVKEFFFDDDTFTDDLPRAIDIAEKLKPLGITWSCNAKANVPYEALQTLKDCGLRLLLVGYESGAQHILNTIKKGIRIERAKQFTQDCKKLGILIHGTFILGLPGETSATIGQTLRYACELDVYSIQVSLAAPYPGTELYRQAQAHGWLIKEDLVSDDGIQEAALAYPELSHEEMFDAVERFYKRFYFRPRPIWRILKDMLKDKEVFKRRLREGREFFSFMATRRERTAE